VIDSLYIKPILLPRRKERLVALNRDVEKERRERKARQRF
jgi:hypothetical protein